MTAPAPSAESTETQPGATPDESKLGDPGKAALEAERAAKRKAEKDLRDALAKLKEFEDAGRSEAEKLAQRETELAARELALLKREVADAAKLPPAWAARLVGATRDELEADAKELAKSLPAPATQPVTPKPPAKPREALKGGGDPSKTPSGDGGGAMPLNGDPLLASLASKLGIPAGD